MPALLITIIVLAFSMTLFEQILKIKVRFLGKMEEKSFMHDFALSGAIGMLFSFLFGATGITIMMASVISWLFGMPISGTKRKLAKSPEFKAEVLQVKRAYRPVGLLLMIPLKIIGFILFRIPVLLNRSLTDHSAAPSAAIIDVTPHQQSRRTSIAA